jgi:hypothetical protein
MSSETRPNARATVHEECTACGTTLQERRLALQTYPESESAALSGLPAGGLLYCPDCGAEPVALLDSWESHDRPEIDPARPIAAGYRESAAQCSFCTDDLGTAPDFFVGWGGILGQWVREGYPIVGMFGAKVTNPDEIAAPEYADDQFYGPVYPDKSFTISTNLNIDQRLTLRAMGEYSGGHYQFNIMPWQEVRRGLWPQCTERQPLSEQPAIWQARCAQPTPPLDPWRMPADYFKLRTASLSYELPAGVLPGASQSSLTLMFRNLWKWQESPGLDPELNVGSFGTFPARYEYYQIPPTTSVTVTLRASF